MTSILDLLSLIFHRISLCPLCALWHDRIQFEIIIELRELASRYLGSGIPAPSFPIAKRAPLVTETICSTGSQVIARIDAANELAAEDSCAPLCCC